MDPLSTPKSEQLKKPIEQQPEVVREQPVTPEVGPIIEVAVEQVAEITPEVKEEPKVPEAQPVVEPVQPIAVAKPAPVVVEKDRLTKEIEEVMEEDLKEMYLAMSKEKQQQFRKQGEVVVSTVRQLVRAAHVNVKKIFTLIRAWLKIIPGVNRYFLEQEAKIKTDKVLLVTEEEKRRGSQL